MDLRLNSLQTDIESLDLKSKPQEIQDQFYNYLNGVPFIRSLVSSDRPYARDLPRDSEGKIIVDITKPHILKDMDYFRPAALHYQKYGCYTDLRPNPNPNSEFGKWFREEIRRCREGYVRPSDGEWITGDYYFFLNYTPMLVSKTSEGSRFAQRVIDFPSVWEGHYYKSHYLEQARKHGLHAAELSRRGCGKSFFGAALLAKRFLLGESDEVRKKVVSYIIAFDKAKLIGGDQTLDKFQYDIDFCAENTQFPSKRLLNSIQNMQWQSGYLDLNSGAKKGTLNSVIGKAYNDASKLRGSRGVLYLFEEAGTFPNLLESYNNLLPSVEDGSNVFGMLYLYGTTGDSQSDFAALQEVMYNPKGYHVYGVDNVYDLEGQGRRVFTSFFPGYLNRANCYDENGNSDVTKALLEILEDRYNVKYNSTDVNSITKRIAEIPITPQEAILRTKGNLFPVTDLSNRLNEIDNNPRFYDDVYTGSLVMNSSGNVEYVPSDDTPIRDFPLKDSVNVNGAVEIFALPEKNSEGKVPFDRYIAGLDPIEDDESGGNHSLMSLFILDLWTDQIVCEYTGRHSYADDCFEEVRKALLFYNARCLYEAHPYDQKVICSDGTIKIWGDVKIGDSLFSIDGSYTKVVDIPVDGEDDIYRFTLADGRTVESSRHHIWKVETIRREVKEITTEEIVDTGVVNKHGQHNFFIPESSGVDFPYREVPIDPYTLGLLIAEGAFTKFNMNKRNNSHRKTIQISSSKEDMDFYKTVIPYPVKYIGTKGYSWHVYIDDIDKKLDSLGLLGLDSHSKFIPDLYLYNSREVRLSLLKGLMDGDGCAVERGASVFITTSERLSNDIKLLSRSLGFKAFNNKEKEPSVMSIDEIRVYNTVKTFRVAIASEEKIFMLPRKVHKQHVYRPYSKGSKASAILYKTAIVKAEYVGRKRCKCVTVDREDGLYLIGDYVVTHNCNLKGIFAYFSKMNCLYLLADTPEYLRDKDLVKIIGYGNKAKGYHATQPLNNYANTLIRNWLIQPVTLIKEVDSEEQEVTMMNLYRIKNRALLKEAMLYNSDGNFDRIRALGACMLLREEKMIQYQGNFRREDRKSDSYKGNDDFFKRNYDAKFFKFKDLYGMNK